MIRRNAFVAVLSVVALVAANHLNAAEFFSEDFSTDGSLGDKLMQTGGGLEAGYSVTGGELIFDNGGGDSARTWIGTNDGDYNTVSFMAEIDVTIEGDFSSSLYLGLGVGESFGEPGPGQTDRGFDQPTVGPSVFIGVRDNGDDLIYTGDFAVDDGDERTFEDGTQIGPQPAEPLQEAGTHRLRMVHNHVAQTVSFFINKNIDDANNDGNFELLLDNQTVLLTGIGPPGNVPLEDPSIVVSENGVFDVSDNGFDGTNARIFFGSSAGRVMDNFSVVALPTPGDFDDDGDVDGDDFLEWQRDPSVGALSDWQGNYGAGLPPEELSAASVPEPTSCLLAALGLLIVGGGQLRRKL